MFDIRRSLSPMSIICESVYSSWDDAPHVSVSTIKPSSVTSFEEASVFFESPPWRSASYVHNEGIFIQKDIPSWISTFGEFTLSTLWCRILDRLCPQGVALVEWDHLSLLHCIIEGPHGDAFKSTPQSLEDLLDRKRRRKREVRVFSLSLDSTRRRVCDLYVLGFSAHAHRIAPHPYGLIINHVFLSHGWCSTIPAFGSVISMSFDATNLVDPASCHMLVSRTKPCKCKSTCASVQGGLCTAHYKVNSLPN